MTKSDYSWLSHSAGSRCRASRRGTPKRARGNRPLIKSGVRFLCALYRMAGLLSRSEQFDSGNRERLTRSPVTTAVVPASHLDVIPGHHLVLDFLLFRSARAHNVLKCAQTHHWTESIWLGATVHKQLVLDLNGDCHGLGGVLFVGPGSCSADVSASCRQTAKSRNFFVLQGDSIRRRTLH